MIQCCLPATEQLLLEGGDARIALDADKVANRYGCSPLPDPALLAFASSTATAISAAGFAAADRLRSRLQGATEEALGVTYVRELSRIRQELLSLCGVADLPGLEVVFAASGTDLHFIAAQLAGGSAATPTLAVMLDAAETGSYVPAALSGSHYAKRTAPGAEISAAAGIEVATVAIRTAEGSPRPAAVIAAEFESRVMAAAAQGRRVLLILADVSKTGCIAPSPALAARLKQRLPDLLDVLVDACQFRIAPLTLRAYLAEEFMVALTGSKFVTGPTFSGALLIPAASARQLRQRPLSHHLLAHASRADWPKSWPGLRDEGANFGLLLRWEAALQELRTFRAVPEEKIAGFLQVFAHAIEQRLLSDATFEPLPVPRLDRRPWLGGDSWDLLPTIFPFLLIRGGKSPLSREQTALVYRLLQEDLSTGYVLADESLALAKLRCQLGQPVACGVKDGVPVSALRLCVSARLVVEATAEEGRHESAVIERALAALDKAALLVGRVLA